MDLHGGFHAIEKQGHWLMKPDKSPWEILQDFWPQQLALSEITIPWQSKQEMYLSLWRAVRPQTDRPLRHSHTKDIPLPPLCRIAFSSLSTCFLLKLPFSHCISHIFSRVLLLHFYAVCSCSRKPNLMANFQFIVWFCYKALCQMITEFLKEQTTKHMRKMPVNSTTTSPQQWCHYEQDEGVRHKGGMGSTCLWVKLCVTRLLIPVSV